MNFSELAAKRYSVRSFESTPVPEDKLQAVLEAGRLAPTACNLQPQRIFVLQSEDALQKIRKCTSCHFNAPIVLMVCYDKTENWTRPFDGFQSGEMDASIVGTHLMLAAFDQGLGSTWVCYFAPDAVKKAFNLPENLVPALLLPIGIPKAGAEPNPMHFDRKNADATITRM